jgi:polyisoprenyl-phosphate glycosyltransferase
MHSSFAQPKLSIVIPCHNEGAGLRELVSLYASHVKDCADVEVIIVNDASSDDSALILDELTRAHPFLRVVTNAVSDGYGNAILSGLKVANGEFIGWTHGDTQTPPEDVFTALSLLEENESAHALYIKGRRYGRPLLDRFFTFGMSVIETLYLGTTLTDINAQPNIFHRSFYKSWQNPPKDFALDLYAFYMAKRAKLRIIRFPVRFGPRKYGSSTWNTGMQARIKFIKRTLAFSRKLKRSLLSQ